MGDRETREEQGCKCTPLRRMSGNPARQSGGARALRECREETSPAITLGSQVFLFLIVLPPRPSLSLDRPDMALWAVVFSLLLPTPRSTSLTIICMIFIPPSTDKIKLLIMSPHVHHLDCAMPMAGQCRFRLLNSVRSFVGILMFSA